ncbi:hypothetical protein GCM10009589_00820 [Arthrobacter pascens]
MQELANSEGVEAGSLRAGRLVQAWAATLPRLARLALPWTLVADDGTDPNQVQKFRDEGCC